MCSAVLRSVRQDRSGSILSWIIPPPQSFCQELLISALVKLQTSARGRKAYTFAVRSEPLDTRAQKLVCNLKMPLLDDAQLEFLASNTSILYIHQIHNTAAKQEREKGYCEIVLGGTDGTESILRALPPSAGAGVRAGRA